MDKRNITVVDIGNGMLVMPETRSGSNAWEKVFYAATIEELPKAVASVKAIIALDVESGRTQKSAERNTVGMTASDIMNQQYLAQKLLQYAPSRLSIQQIEDLLEGKP